ncbi:asparagine synthase (glutamine-hydrolyzing) [Thiocapsa imhoffii]|uniref:asparagine synthase (glutamine-hydrolyzing) n=1 Tax=Thiocapsa imhoffii TaxID=382777 RepID=A0A9X0WHN3_9GAMM|nr:asparagine synthase (glutamine-hydrolyzing) [Thiocapsa imhoffii]MBK1644911.1 asparagine synthase (glutamine-hydrolyzing) [Thiocapsa imhoffii]
MCGLCGVLETSAERAAVLREAITRMTDTLVHRGPDDQGSWVDAEAGLALGHRRLSILDLSPQGHQPMVSACGRFVLVFNGEIYNHAALRRDLGADQVWRGHSDTEVLLAWIARHGVARTLPRLNGMFAFALWDRQHRALTLARDRLGEKPLYYGWNRGRFLFGSELKALTAHPEWHGELDRDALAAYLRLSFVPAPHSIYQGIRKLQPGTFAHLESGRTEPRITAYWSAREAAEQGCAHPFAGTEAQALDALESLLRDAIGLRMQADVPLGAFLSGGIDSTAIVALMQSQSSRPVQTFSIGFHEAGFDEAPFARRLAAHLGTDHTELYVTAQDGLDTVARLPRLWDEPFADPSQIPTYLLSAMARRGVTVCLSGDGGDELFGGYSRYLWTRDTWRGLGKVPLAVRRAMARAVLRVGTPTWDRLLRPLGRFLPGPLAINNPGDRLHKAVDVLTGESPEALYLRMLSHWKDPAAIVIGAREPVTVLTDPALRAHTGSITESMMFMDSLLYLPDDILVKVDRASMAVSLEARVPLLDHRVFEFAWSLPLHWKVRGRVGKLPLRQICERYCPPALFERPKMGFGIPLEHWLRGPLRDWAEALLAPARLRADGILHPEPIRLLWEEHLAGRRNWSYYLWDVLMFQAWLDATPRWSSVGAGG